MIYTTVPPQSTGVNAKRTARRDAGKQFFALYLIILLKMVISGRKMNTGKTPNANTLKNEIIPQGTLATGTGKNGFCQYHWSG
jgi:hypothetical protein